MNLVVQLFAGKNQSFSMTGYQSFIVVSFFIFHSYDFSFNFNEVTVFQNFTAKKRPGACQLTHLRDKQFNSCLPETQMPISENETIVLNEKLGFKSQLY